MARSSDSNFLFSLLRDKTFQAKEIRRVIKLSLIYLTITTALVGLFYHYMLNKLLVGTAPLLFVSEDIAMVNEALPAMSSVLGAWMLAMLGANLAITVALAIYITRKLGHPILAIKRALREVGNGNLDVRLRSTDRGEFGEIVSELNAAMHAIRVQISAAKNSMEQVNNFQAVLPDSESGHARCDHLDMALDNCRSALEFFQVEDSSVKELAIADEQDRKAS